MADLFATPDWAQMDQAARDRAYNNSAAVPQSGALVQDWEARSAALRQDPRATCDLRYGPKDRNRFDCLRGQPGLPTLAFIHGGYWQMRSKETFTFCSLGPLAHGFNVAHLGYTLAPDATLDDMVGEIHAGLDALVAALPKLGITSTDIILGGWSAGAHLAAMGLDHPHVRAGLLISGVYDLRQIPDIYVNTALQLDPKEAPRLSPALQLNPSPKPCVIVAGAAELPHMRQQSALLAAHRVRHGCATGYEEIPGANHFTIMDALAEPSGRITQVLRGLSIQGSV